MLATDSNLKYHKAREHMQAGLSPEATTFVTLGPTTDMKAVCKPPSSPLL